MEDRTTPAQQETKAEIVQLERQLQKVIRAARAYVAGERSLQSLEDTLDTAEAHLTP